MIDKTDHQAKNEPKFSDQIGLKAARKLKAQRSHSDVWFGLGMMGLIGWSVVIPTLLGTGLGIWLDSRHSSRHSWTLALLIVGLVLGCMNAWHWVSREDRTMRDEQGENDD